ncbi:YeiH family protein [Salinibacillus xinjiangensis]|uniref:Putative sulfate exporter family transporter n=1 Tax=Salinibacillus xinjiangensis TaxID=1229268 RepID=A0A6G1X236_9BACI|nr:YeiH family protein [Salinibacillus xinjiangensis]MRG85002.1 putative sulfate exporter family transporter [Salinibacillus xinjiangensis]
MGVQKIKFQSTNTPKSSRPNLLTHFQRLYKGVILTTVLALVASQLATLPFLSIAGVMIISIFVGVSWKSIMGVPTEANAGVTFSSKVLLKLGIVLMGLNLNIAQIAEAGLPVITIDIIVIVFTLTVFFLLGRMHNVDKHLTALIGVGTAVCGASAIVAVAPLIKAKKEHTALAVACIAVFGTIGAITYVMVYPALDLEPYTYGVLVGSTLHEVAHVVAAGASGGSTGAEAAIITKLGRVALLIPVAIILGIIFSYMDKKVNQEKKSFKHLPIPWFLFGFLLMIVVNSLQVIPTSLANSLVSFSGFLLAMSMVGLGLNINFVDFKKTGFKPILVGLLGFIALAILGPFLLYLL